MAQALVRALRINAFCEIGMGLAFMFAPDTMIPELTSNGRTTTRVLGSSLVAFGYMTSQSDDTKRLAGANLLFHIVAGFVLGMDVFQRVSSPFLPPTLLHIFLAVLLIYSGTSTNFGASNENKGQ